jgi:hypothetical protein
MKSDIKENLGRFREVLTQIAESGPSGADQEEYISLRAALLSEPKLNGLLPVFVDEQRLPRHFWNYIKALFHEGIGIYEKRSQYIEAQLLPVERQFQSASQKAPGDRPTEKIITYLPPPPAKTLGTLIINEERIAELRTINSAEFDLTKLVRLCEELNVAFSNGCFLAAIMLTRAIIDHVPPVFKANKFTEVVNNYNGSRSFKEAMEHLEKGARKIADGHIHVQIRKREVLPMPEQVNFSQEIDLLFSEIVRILS